MKNFKRNDLSQINYQYEIKNKVEKFINILTL